MKKLYEKNEVLFAVLWIAAYCALTIPIRGSLGDESPLMLVALVAIAAGATAFIKAYSLEGHYGLDHLPKRPGAMLYYIPMLVLATGNLWGGVSVAYKGLSQLWAVLSMLMIGYVEEVLFRGFLFKALLKKDGATTAVIVAAVTFGIGHIVNLLAGQANLETVMQVLFAVAWGFLFTFAFWKGGSLWPCIVVHSLVDIFSKFSTDSTTAAWVYIGATILAALVYCPYLARLKTPEE